MSGNNLRLVRRNGRPVPVPLRAVVKTRNPDIGRIVAAVLLVLFLVNFSWIAVTFTSSILGLLMLLFGSAVLLLRLRRGAPELAIESGGLRRARLASAIIAVVTVPLWIAMRNAPIR